MGNAFPVLSQGILPFLSEKLLKEWRRSVCYGEVPAGPNRRSKPILILVRRLPSVKLFSDYGNRLVILSKEFVE